MIFGSVCSGIEAASVAWHPLGWKAAWLAEIEPFPAAVLAHHYPEVPNLGDMTKIATRIMTGEVEAPDVLVGGTPCQAFSVAGLRKSLDDERGQLSIAFIHLADAIDAVRSLSGREPATIVWENVPGVLSTGDNAFGCFLAGLAGEDSELLPAGKKWTNAGCVYGPKRAVAWRILDAQYFGLAQRRRRVFVVASSRNGIDPSRVLFELDGMRRDSPPSREAGEGAAGTLAARTGGGGFPGTDEACSGYVQPARGYQRPSLGAKNPTAVSYGTRTANTSSNGWGIQEEITHTLDTAHGVAVAHPIVVHGTQDPCTSTTTAFALGRNNGGENAIAFAQNSRDEVRLMGGDGQIVGALAAEPGMKQTCYVAQAVSIRGRDGGATAELGDEVGNCLRTSGGGGDKAHVLAPVHEFFEGLKDGNAKETGPIEALRMLREAIGEEAFNKWASGIAFSLQQKEILRCEVHGSSIRCEADEGGCRLDDGALSCAESCSSWPMREVWQAGCQRRAPQGRGLPEQLSRELDSALSQLPHEGAQPAWLVQCLRGTGEGFGILQSALPAAQSGETRMQVRRLTPREAERLQGFQWQCGPDYPGAWQDEAGRWWSPDYTLIPWRNKPLSDCPNGPRYKALGNSMAVPCMSWIGHRIQAAIEFVKENKK